MMTAALLLLASGVEAPASLDAFFEDFSKRRAHIRVLEARFVQDNITPGDRYRSEGTLVYIRPRQIAFRYADPEIVYLVDGVSVYEYDVELEQVQIYDLGDEPEMEALFLGFASDTRKLREAYAIEFFDTGGAEGVAKGLELRPKPRPEQPPIPGAGAVGEEQQNHFFERARLYLRENDYLPVRIHTDVDAESQVDLRITDFKLNAALDPSILQVDLPEGTKIVKNEELVETVGPGGKRIPETVVAPRSPPTENGDAEPGPAQDGEGS